jgi:hypothetical protein
MEPDQGGSTMANHYYNGFSNIRQRTAFQNAIEEAQMALPTILKDARLNNRDIATRAYRLFFGAFSLDRHERVIGILSLMDLALNSAGITFTRVVGGNPNTCAATPPPYGIWGDQTPAQIAASAHRHEWAYKMKVCDRFYDAVNSLSGSVKDAQFNTVCHELSHLVGDTVDEDAPGDDVYGYWDARNLATADPDQAVKCAENYGFYCEACYSGDI